LLFDDGQPWHDPAVISEDEMRSAPGELTIVGPLGVGEFAGLCIFAADPTARAR
jgi:hypothetical protein